MKVEVMIEQAPCLLTMSKRISGPGGEVLRYSRPGRIAPPCPETGDTTVAIDRCDVACFARPQVEFPPVERVGMVAARADEFDLVGEDAVLLRKRENLCFECRDRCVGANAFVPLLRDRGSC
ncbi:hypothetical protein [Burkholderia sp. Bp8963]|uniref:hypothetical protein n=1 Tax=Burkholderia sp. Bp8963 TaxID=2184547 RepID=UPI000F592BC9|nr:hypothetical protein [Burkholderia sp. Bp8963]